MFLRKIFEYDNGKWIYVYVYINVNIYNKFKEYECISMYLLCVYGIIYVYLYMNMNKKNIYKGSEIL